MRTPFVRVVGATIVAAVVGVGILVGTVGNGAPASAVLPVVTGTVQVAQTVSTSNGSWANAPTAFRYKWQSSPDGSSGWADINSATSSAYTLQAGDVSRYVRSVVTATNSSGSTAANSLAVGPVASSGGPSNANVFVAPPAGATDSNGNPIPNVHGADNDGTNCARLASTQTPPGGVGFGCATFQKAYTLAQPGDVIALNWSGQWWSATQQILGPTGNKSATMGGCSGPGDTAACVTFAPGSGLTPSNAYGNDLASPTTSNNSGGFLVCADHVELNGLTFDHTTFGDTAHPTVGTVTVTQSSYQVGVSGSTCLPSGAPPHDVYVKNVISNEQIIMSGSAGPNIYIQGGALQHVLNFPNNLGGGYAPSGSGVPVNNVTIDGVHFDDYVGTDSQFHHMVVIHLGPQGDNAFKVINNLITNAPTSGSDPYAIIRFEADLAGGDGLGNVVTNTLVQNNYIDTSNASGVQALSLNCHDANCHVTGNTIRFNTIAAGIITLTNDCALQGLPGCTVNTNVMYGNLFKTGSCPSNAAALGLGWAENTNVWTAGNGGGICTGDSTSAFSATITLAQPGSPFYNGALTCPQTAGNFVVPASIPGFPATDILGAPRPKPGNANLDAGAYETC